MRDIYAQYRIPPWLQLHQLRVAAVGSLVLQAQEEKIDESAVILACLFHDMGNILKFDFSPNGPFEEVIEENGSQYWRGVQDGFREKYGTDEHDATVAIAHEIDISAEAISIIDQIGFSNIPDIFPCSKELWVAQYADMRVGPPGIIPIGERVADLKARYAKRSKSFADAELVDANEKILQEMEEKLFMGGRIRPEDISDAAVAPVIEELWEYPIA